jgi:peptidoglycan/LPS O-acetylase OafA/YrhL
MTIPNRPSDPAIPTPRFDTIDTLRGLSILVVVLLHTSIRFSFEDLTLKSTLPPWLFHVLLQQGGNGVTVFFAVSGFLITYTSIERFGSLANFHPLVFYRIRFARIAPLLLLFLAVLTALHYAHVDGYVVQHGTLPGALLSALTFTLGWYEAVHGWLPACWTVLWSLSIEETFYLFFPLATVLTFRIPNPRAALWFFVTLLTTFVILAPFARTIWTGGNDIWAENTYLGGMGPIAQGCLTALLTHYLATRPPSRRTLLTLQQLGTFLVLWMVLWPRWQWLRPLMHRIAIADIDDVILPLGACLIMLATVLRGGRGSRFTAPLRWFGRHSYEVYLSHEFLVILGVEAYLALKPHHAPGPLGLWFVGILLATAPLGYLVARFFSEPLNRKLRPKHIATQ